MKKNSTLLLILAVCILGAIAYWVMKTDDSKGGGKAMSDFAIENTDEIDKIIITEVNGNKAELEKGEEYWILNNKYRARAENIELILKTFKNIAVQSAVSSSAKKNVVTGMAARNKKVEIFQNGKLLKKYYIGSPTKDHYGTYMLLEKNGVKSSEPYIMHIPGFNGFLESRFFTNENDWKYTGVFVYDPLDIQKIKVEFKGQPESSYLVTQFDKKVQLNTVDGTSIKDFVKPLVENYILNYEKIYFNRIAELSENKVDSIMSLEPEYRIEVTVNNRPTKVDFYLKPSDNPSVDLVTGEENIWDENYIYGVMNGKKEVLVFQYFALGNVFSRKEYFIQ